MEKLKMKKFFTAKKEINGIFTKGKVYEVTLSFEDEEVYFRGDSGYREWLPIGRVDRYFDIHDNYIIL